MRLYLDVSCLNRPFDDQSQERVRLEAEAVRLIVGRFDVGEWEQISSEMAEIEVAAIRDVELRRNVTRLLPDRESSLKLNQPVFERSLELQSLGLQTADALHVAAAESGRVDALLTCDDRLLKWSVRHRRNIKIEVANPITWLAHHASP
jgi:predicted nucleic acid-binding protein